MKMCFSVQMFGFLRGHQRRCHHQSLWRILRNHLNVRSLTLAQDTRRFIMNKVEIIMLCCYVSTE